MSVIKIDIKDTKIPFLIGPLEFSVDVSDHSLERLQAISEEMEEKFKEPIVTIEQGRAILAESFDKLLGDGAFEKIYEICPSVIKCQDILWDVFDGIKGNLVKGKTQPELAEAYLKKKKKK